MHRLLLPLACFLLLTGARPATAQHQRSDRAGFRLGGSVAQYRGEDADAGGSSRLGLCGGLVLHLPVSKALSVQPEFLFSQKGASDQPFALSSTLTARGSQRLTYVELPLLVKLRSQVGPFIELGPALGYLLSASADYTAPNGQSATADNARNFKRFDWSLAAGLGYQGAKGLLLGLRYHGGLSSVFTAGSYRGVGGEARIYNQAFQVYAGYIFFGRPQAEFPE
ncbi:hypothetical protein GCM10023185_35180 [Hymenobacter saemangeumensis]|uniref:Outer membrane protein beta-barrel domain-containing protein n=1 Tax=Hymenobacter saemangeumensis TaxID=1084522 RepID=A0ABP8IP82_9BACT